LKANYFLLFASRRIAFPLCFDGGSEQSVFSLIRGLVNADWNVFHVSVLPSKWSGEVNLPNSEIEIAIFSKVQRLELNKRNFILVTNNNSFYIRFKKVNILFLHPDDFNQGFEDIIPLYLPNLIVTWLGGSQEILTTASKLSIHSVNICFGPGKDSFPMLQSGNIILANSLESANLCEEIYGYQPYYINSIVEIERYRSKNRRLDYLTYINPRTEKGLFIFIEIAKRLNDIKFLLVKGWNSMSYNEMELQALQFLRTLPNVKIIDPVTDMRQVYEVTSILLVPSQWIETFGRVVIEAQCNGIPVIASDKGSLPFTVGRGGIISASDPVLWAEVIYNILHNDDLYVQLSNYALNNVIRFSPEKLIVEFEKFFISVIHQRPYLTQKSSDTFVEYTRAEFEKSRKSIVYEQLHLKVAQKPLDL
jgi:glycosyltransferase involved in cell wall biosynthesis